MTTPRVQGLRETALYVDDLPRAAALNQRVFGFETLFDDEDGHLAELITPGFWRTY